MCHFFHEHGGGNFMQHLQSLRDSVLPQPTTIEDTQRFDAFGRDSSIWFRWLGKVAQLVVPDRAAWACSLLGGGSCPGSYDPFAFLEHGVFGFNGFSFISAWVKLAPQAQVGDGHDWL